MWTRVAAACWLLALTAAACSERSGGASKPAASAATQPGPDPALERYRARVLETLIDQMGPEVVAYRSPVRFPPPHVVEVFRRGDGPFVVATNGLGFVRQPGTSPGAANASVELITWSSEYGPQISQFLSLLGAAMMRGAESPWDAWSYDTVPLDAEICGLQFFVLRPGAELEVPLADRANPRVSFFTVIPVSRDEYQSMQPDRARDWVEAHTGNDERARAMLLRWSPAITSGCDLAQIVTNTETVRR